MSPAPTAEVPPDPLLWFAEQAISADGFGFVTSLSASASRSASSASASVLLKGWPSRDPHPGNIVRKDYRLNAEEGSRRDRFLSLKKVG